jgi:hypothetical protein
MDEDGGIRVFGGHQFELVFSSDDKQKAKKRAERYKASFFTLVREVMPGTWGVYRRPRPTVSIRNIGT